MEKIRIAFIGCGGVANGHASRVAAIEETEIVALCDTSPEALTGFKERHPELADVPVFADWRELLDKTELDAVELHTPHTLHYEQIMASLDLGLHVLTEKPMVCSSEHAVAVARKVAESGLKLQVSYQRHFEGAFRYMRELISSGDFGEVHSLAALQAQEWKNSQHGTWRQDPELSGGGQLNDSGSHLIDIMLWVTGLAADEVHAFIDNRGTKVDINSVVNVRFANGAQGSIAVVGDSVQFWEDMTIWGEHGVLYYRNGVLSQADRKGRLVEPRDMPSSTDPDRNFIDAILGRAELEVPVECGVRVIELTEAAWQSAERSGPVKVRRTDI